MLDHSASLPKTDKELVCAVREWLGKDGISFFHRVKKESGSVGGLINDGSGIPHPVHFREGMAVRNKLRELTAYSWTDHEYDNRWEGIVEKAIAG